MKTMRADEHDLQAIVEIRAHAPLELGTLVDRFQLEMDAASDPERLRANFLVVVERLFPHAVERVARSLRH
jgi:hypothetical protein